MLDPAIRIKRKFSIKNSHIKNLGERKQKTLNQNKLFFLNIDDETTWEYHKLTVNQKLIFFFNRLFKSVNIHFQILTFKLSFKASIKDENRTSLKLKMDLQNPNKEFGNLNLKIWEPYLAFYKH